MMQLGRKHLTIIHNTRSLIRTLKYVLDILQTEDVFTVEEYKHKHTHTHTHTHISIAKTVSKKIGALIRSMKFLSLEVALYLYKSTIRPCMEYCYRIWVGASSCYLELLDQLQKRIYRTVAPSLAASLEPLAHRQNVVSLRPQSCQLFASCQPPTPVQN